MGDGMPPQAVVPPSSSPAAVVNRGRMQLRRAFLLSIALLAWALLSAVAAAPSESSDAVTELTENQKKVFVRLLSGGSRSVPDAEEAFARLWSVVDEAIDLSQISASPNMRASRYDWHSVKKQMDNTIWLWINDMMSPGFERDDMLFTERTYANMLSQSRATEAVAIALGMLRPPVPVSAPRGYLPPLDVLSESEMEAAARALRSDGVHRLGRLKLPFLSRLRETLERDVVYSGVDHAGGRFTSRGVAFRYDEVAGFASSPEGLLTSSAAINKVVDQSQLLQISPEVWELALDPSILSVVQRHLRAAPTLTQTNAWWTQATVDKTGEQRSEDRGGDDQRRPYRWKGVESEQRFHQDCPNHSGPQVKVFVYLYDTDRSNGAHRYIPGSKRRVLRLYDQHLFQRVFEESTVKRTVYCGERYPTHALENAFCSTQDTVDTLDERVQSRNAAGHVTCEKYVEGPAGTVFIADTENWHSATAIDARGRGGGASWRSNVRLVLQFVYSATSKDAKVLGNKVRANHFQTIFMPPPGMPVARSKGTPHRVISTQQQGLGNDHSRRYRYTNRTHELIRHMNSSQPLLFSQMQMILPPLEE